MHRSRYLILAAAGMILFGSLAATGGYAWYLRSAGYRQACVQQLSDALELPCDIGRVVPRSWRSREFDDVVVWLPNRRDRALTCRQALVMNTPLPDDPDAYELQLLGGTCEISTRTWLGSDYRHVIESGLRPGFAPDGPRDVYFGEMDLTFDRNGFRATLRHAGGRIHFIDSERGEATIHCREFNGHACSEPVLLQATFSPQRAGIRIDRLELSVPRLPLAIVGLQHLLGPDVRSGTFDGRLLYEEHDVGSRITVSGKCFDLNLTECTAGLMPQPWRGLCHEIELRELTLENDRPQRLRFAGTLTDVVPGDLLAMWGLGQVDGKLTLRVGTAELSRSGIDRFVAAGQCINVSLEQLTTALGWGRMTGTLRIAIDDLTIENNQLKSLDATITVDPAGDEPNWVEGRLLRELVRRALKLDLPNFLPERIDYIQFGVRLEVRDEVLYVFGTHGPREHTILTVWLWDQELPLVWEPHRSFDLRPGLDVLRIRAAERLRHHLEARSQTAGPSHEQGSN